MFVFKQLLTDFFNLLFPDTCHGCGRQLYHGEDQLCTHCIYDLSYTDFHLYPENKVARLFWGRLHCHSAMAMLYFKKGSRLQQLIHSLKYKGQSGIGIKFGEILGERLLAANAFCTADLIIPVPLHKKRLNSRGYNQSECIANGMAQMMHLPLNTTQLIRHMATGTQTRKNRYNRFENMQEVFAVTDPATLKNRHVLLVDDVITTGATLEACGQVLLEAGVKKLSIVALAFAE